jgi:MtaA/CmuA family methyltransferase
MNSYERFYNRLAGRPVDKIPNLNIVMALAAKEAGVSYRVYAQDYHRLVEGNLRCAEKYGFDTVSAISDPVREAAAFGSEIVFPENGVPYCKKELFHDGYDLSKLKITDPCDNERTLDRIRAVELFNQEVKGEIPIIGWVEGVLAECADLRGVSDLMMDLMESDFDLKELFDIVYDRQCKFAETQIKAGADIIGIGNAVASLIGPALYEEHALEYDRKLIYFVHENGAKTRLHICGNISPLLPLLRTTGTDILDIDWMVDYAKAAARMEGTDTRINGNMDPVGVMERGTVGDVEEKTAACIAQSGACHMIACGCEVPAATPEENLTAMNRLLVRS